ALEVDSLDLLAPELVADGDHDEAEVLLLQPYVPEQVLTHFLQTLPRERPRAIERLPKTGGLGANTIAHLPGLRHNLQVGGIRFLALLVGGGLDGGRHVRFLRFAVREEPPSGGRRASSGHARGPQR